MNDKIRLQKYIAKCGVASRRHAEELIKAGRVKVNGAVIEEMGTLVSEDDIVEVDNRIISTKENSVYIILNKPAQYVTTVKDPEGRRTVLDLVQVKERVYPVGRLDYDTTGLLILTNDGDFTNNITHPSNEINKTYIAEVTGFPSEDSLHKLKSGIMLDGRLTSKAEACIVEEKANSTVLKIIIGEGRNRQVKRMCEYIGHPVVKLERTAIGKLELGNLKQGKWRYMTPYEINLFRRSSNG